jgi:hypothetical protein
MNSTDWHDQFRQLFAEGVKRYRAGQRAVADFFTPEETAFLTSLGCNAQELFDFVEDYTQGGDPTFETVLLVTAIRRQYFLEEQSGQASGKIRPMSDFPTKGAELDGIAWLPRIIEKARTKLRGELPAEMMYGCGGDRPFLRRNQLNLPDFLRVVWRTGDDTDRIVAYVKDAAAKV